MTKCEANVPSLSADLFERDWEFILLLLLWLSVICSSMYELPQATALCILSN